MPRRQSTRATAKVVPIRTRNRKPVDQAVDESHDVIESAAVLIGTGLGKAIRTTRAIRERASAVSETIVETGKRAGKRLKDSLPSIGTKKKSSAASRTRVRKTTPPAPAHGEDPLTHQATPATKRSTKAASPIDARRRVNAPRRG